MIDRMMRMVFLAPLILVGFLAFLALGGWIVMLLWNWLTPALFGWHLITFWQALGLLALARILFGGLGLHGGRGWRGERWRPGDPETRERFRQRVRERVRRGVRISLGIEPEEGPSPPPATP